MTSAKRITKAISTVVRAPLVRGKPKNDRTASLFCLNKVVSVEQNKDSYHTAPAVRVGLFSAKN